MYDWATTEVNAEDRPDRVVINDDRKFDSWLESMERKVKESIVKTKAMRLKAGME